jgi:hypothetical protein
MTLYHGGARIPAGYGDAAASADTFDWTSFAKTMANATVAGVGVYQTITTADMEAKAALAAQKQQFRQDRALAKALSASTPAPGYLPAPGSAPGYSPAPAASGIDTTTLLLLGGLGLAAVYLLTRSK